MMDVDPRLRSYTYNNTGYSFPPHAGAEGFDSNVSSYALNFDQQQQPSTRPAVTSPRRGQQNATVQESPKQKSLRGGQGQATTLNQRMVSPSVRKGPPNRPNAVNTNASKQPISNLVFKNSTQTYPQGASIAPSEPSIFALNPLAQPPSNLHHNTNADYFSSEPFSVSNDAPSSPPPTNDSANPFSSTFPLIPDPPDLGAWRSNLYNITDPIHLTQSQFLTYFPHIDNVYSHRSTQKYKRKPFLSQYWDCRLKGRPSGTKKSSDPNVKRRKREKRELGLCDVKIKITEWFGREEALEMGLTAVALGEGEAAFDVVGGGDGLQIVMEGDIDPSSRGRAIEGGQGNWPKGHPGGDGKKWYTIQRVNGTGMGKKGNEDEEDEDEMGGNPDEERNLDHKHSLEESDRIKKNSVQRWLLKEEKERRASKKTKIDPSLPSHTTTSSHTQTHPHSSHSTSTSPPTTFLASGPARATVQTHKPPVSTHLTFYANAFCPFAQRVWIALEIKNIPYQFVEVTPDMLRGFDAPGAFLAGRNDRRSDNLGLINAGARAGKENSVTNSNDNAKTSTSSSGPHLTSPTKSTNGPPPDLLSVNPDAIVPAIKHGNWGIWESNVMMEYLEDLSLDLGTAVGGISLLPVGQPQLKAHCRLWVDHVNRKVLPAFYSLLLAIPPRRGGRGGENGEGAEGGNGGSGDGMELDGGNDSVGANNHTHNNADGHNNASTTQDIQSSHHSILISTLQTAITSLVNASHATGPFFLGSSISYVDVAFAPWIIRLSRVLSYYRNFPRPEVGTRWQAWVEAVEGDERVRRTISEERSYHGVYRGVGVDGIGVEGGRKGVGGVGEVEGVRGEMKVMVEMQYAQRILSEEGFGLGGDLYGKMGLDPGDG